MKWLLLAACMLPLAGCAEEVPEARLAGAFTEGRTAEDMAEVRDILAPYDVAIMESFPEQFSVTLPMEVCQERRDLLEDKPYLRSLSPCRPV